MCTIGRNYRRIRLAMNNDMVDSLTLKDTLSLYNYIYSSQFTYTIFKLKKFF